MRLTFVVLVMDFAIVPTVWTLSWLVYWPYIAMERARKWCLDVYEMIDAEIGPPGL